MECDVGAYAESGQCGVKAYEIILEMQGEGSILNTTNVSILNTCASIGLWSG